MTVLQAPGLAVVPAVSIRVRSGAEITARVGDLERYLLREEEVPLSRHPGWLGVLQQGLGHAGYCLEAMAGDELSGFLPLSFVRSWLFGRFLVSLPYLNYGGPITDDENIACRLVDEAVQLADK